MGALPRYGTATRSSLYFSPITLTRNSGTDAGAGTPTVTIQGVKRLHGATHELIPDRIEAATFAIAAAVTDGEVRLRGARADHLHAVFDKLADAGVKVDAAPLAASYEPAITRTTPRACGSAWSRRSRR